jgi:PP-loop superfamily ATP-utilizing enzyme
LNNLEGVQADFYNWKRLPGMRALKNNKVNVNLHNIGQGFSKMLQTFSTDNLSPNDKTRQSLLPDKPNESEILTTQNREFLSDTEDDIAKKLVDERRRAQGLPWAKKCKIIIKFNIFAKIKPPPGRYTHLAHYFP